MASNRRRKKTDIVLLTKAGVFLVVIVLAIILMLSIMKLAEGPVADNSGTKSQTSSADTTSFEDISFGGAESKDEIIEFKSVTVENTKINTGNLVLVNKDYPFVAVDGDDDRMITVYSKKSGDYKIGSTELKLKQEVVEALNTMMKSYTQLYSKKDLTVVSGYRTVDEQDNIYNDRVKKVGEDKAATEVAKGGYSDNHTGLALSFMIVTGQNVYKFDPAGEYAWVAENAFRYGFVQRFHKDKATVTGMDGTDGYYRYVGLPHSYIMNVGNLSLEEYISFVKTYRYDKEMLTQELDGKVYKVYYHPADSGAVTNVPVPANASSYEISGNNIDGFIVTAVYNS